MSNEEKHDSTPERSVGRRDLMKLGAGAVIATVAASTGSAQQIAPNPGPPVAPGSMRGPNDIRPHTGPGYKNDANRLAGNGPMDDTSRQIVHYVHEFKASDVTEKVAKAFNRTMLDSMASLIAGFEEEPCRIATRMARYSPPGVMKSTILGYGVSTGPEIATFANGCLIRMVDFNDNADGGHVSTLIPAAMAIGEALHCTGQEVMEAIILGYEVASGPTGGESVTAAMVAGKLMKLDEDRLANALTIALTPHVALNKGVGALSMWKSVRSAESAKCGVWAAMLAKEGMTGPPQPFEGKGGLWSMRGGGNGGEGGGNRVGRPFTLPTMAGQMSIERNWFKRRPSEASSQGLLVIMPEIRQWVKPEEIAAIQYDTSYGIWDEICDAPKWDPRNRETADHSLPYILARALMDGDIYLDSFDEAKYMDPAAKALMDKMTFGPVPNWQGLGVGRIAITKKSGEKKIWDTYDGARVLGEKEYPHMTDAEIMAKFNRACAFKKMADSQRDQAYKIWGNLREVKDFATAMSQLAKFGQPKAL